MNGTSFFYAHTSQWRHEKLGVNEILCPTADGKMANMALIDYNAKAERMGWLPSARSWAPTRWTSPARPKPPAKTPSPTPSSS